MGLLQGWIEVVWLRRRFEKQALWVKIVLKTSFYLIFIILFLIGVALVNSLIADESTSEKALNDLQRFVSNFAFWSIIIYIGVTLVLTLFFSEISQYLGNGVLYNFLFGRYHVPKSEIRIFMFLDMRASTSIAERLGHKRYFRLLKTYYADMTEAILDTSGEIYQYVGDEIVVSWQQKKGVRHDNCIRCFKKIKKVFHRKSATYLERFGLVPEFKAGYHIGEVTTGEIGIIKKDIIYTGDVLNTSARIQDQCNGYNADVLISGNLLKELSKDMGTTFVQIGKLTLRGKQEPIELFKMELV
ncbi:adenylate/guanylate cyclase domain-containing protein [Flavobacteriaceae bacterium TP-CH-4]|uniref:Adenylate/guanylate cyclase domain-containing protein n=1 Tax=Pelagihabitans pacificus TaxID=2696054 RepID=A0A967ASC4_9FLAO|nr:adenylate/guanylate cyclase domain-containing protein [Pelagihabitans pacificus]NHF59474.1 adenylate/guanylate cyclase domain-containing protein [Pelagihabitans pacificus]